jgi:hypothetical protein
MLQTLVVVICLGAISRHVASAVHDRYWPLGDVELAEATLQRLILCEAVLKYWFFVTIGYAVVLLSVIAVVDERRTKFYMLVGIGFIFVLSATISLALGELLLGRPR